MGNLFLATDERLGIPVAAKLPQEGGFSERDLERYARIRQEAKIQASLRAYDNIAKIFDFGTDPINRCHYIIMELLTGSDLEKVVEKQGPVAPTLVVDWMLQALRGLAAGHRVGVIHHDVKPSNLFLHERAEHRDGFTARPTIVKVLDFGIATKPHSEDETSDYLQLLGWGLCTPAFASPEQHMASRDITPATDVFSLAATAYYLLTGQLPFRFEELGQYLARHGVEILPRDLDRGQADFRMPSLCPIIPDLSQSVQSVLLRALAWDPSDRFSDAGAFLQALRVAAGPDSERGIEGSQSQLGVRISVARAAVDVELARIDVEAPIERSLRSSDPWAGDSSPPSYESPGYSVEVGTSDDISEPQKAEAFAEEDSAQPIGQVLGEDKIPDRDNPDTRAEALERFSHSSRVFRKVLGYWTQDWIFIVALAVGVGIGLVAGVLYFDRLFPATVSVPEGSLTGSPSGLPGLQGLVPEGTGPSSDTTTGTKEPSVPNNDSGVPQDPSVSAKTPGERQAVPHMQREIGEAPSQPKETVYPRPPRAGWVYFGVKLRTGPWIKRNFTVPGSGQDPAEGQILVAQSSTNVRDRFIAYDEDHPRITGVIHPGQRVEVIAIRPVPSEDELRDFWWIYYGSVQ
jgi:serine/threonine protein kinase